MYEKNVTSEANFNRHYLNFQRKYHIITQKQYGTFTHKLTSCQTVKHDPLCQYNVMKQEREITEHVKPPKNTQQAYDKEHYQINNLENKIDFQDMRLSIHQLMSDYLHDHKVTPEQAIKIKEQENQYSGNCSCCLTDLLVNLITNLPRVLKQVA